MNHCLAILDPLEARRHFGVADRIDGQLAGAGGGCQQRPRPATRLGVVGGDVQDHVAVHEGAGRGVPRPRMCSMGARPRSRVNEPVDPVPRRHERSSEHTPAHLRDPDDLPDVKRVVVRHMEQDLGNRAAPV